MARKPHSSSLRVTPCAAPEAEHPWLKSYPEGLEWDTRFKPALVHSLLDEAVQAYGTRSCTYFMGKRLSFAEIGALSDRAAKGLHEIGVGEGVKVGLLLPNSPTFVIFYYGVLKAGGTVVNFNPLYSLDEIEFQIRDSGTNLPCATATISSRPNAAQTSKTRTSASSSHKTQRPNGAGGEACRRAIEDDDGFISG